MSIAFGNKDRSCGRWHSSSLLLLVLLWLLLWLLLLPLLLLLLPLNNVFVEDTRRVPRCLFYSWLNGHYKYSLFSGFSGSLLCVSSGFGRFPGSVPAYPSGALALPAELWDLRVAPFVPPLGFPCGSSGARASPSCGSRVLSCLQAVRRLTGYQP